MGQQSTAPGQQQAQQQQALTKLIVPEEKATYLHQLANLSVESLQLLAECSRKPGVEAKLKKNAILIKGFL